MFYPVESLRRGGRFYLCWVADSWPLRFAAIRQRQLWSQDIREICQDLLEVIVQESGRPSNRFSLRLSSQLLRGLVRLYQRKVTDLAGDLCMINALAMKSTHKRSPDEQGPHETRRHQIPRLVFEEQPDEERVLELIQNSGNIVAHVEDITLREPTLPENRPIDDGFGELQPYQQLMVVTDRTLEMMLARDTTAATSALDIQLDVSDKSHDKSRLVAHDGAAMEPISERDLSVLGKCMTLINSMGGELRTVGDFDKEISEISVIPPPELSAPQETQADVGKNMNVGEPITEQIPQEQRPNLSLEEIALEELERERLAKKRKPTKLKIDRKKKLSTDYIRSRIADNNVEISEVMIYDVIHVPANQLLERPTCVGHKVRCNLGLTLRRMYLRNLGHGKRHLAPEVEIEEPLARRITRNSALEKINEEIEPIHVEPPILQPPEIIPDINIKDATVVEHMDITDLPTQRIRTLTQTDIQTEDMVSPPKRMRTGQQNVKGSFKKSKKIQMEEDLDTNKENVPTAERIESLLQEAGLADMQDKPYTQTNIQTQANTRVTRKDTSDSETQLGSLDRTKVSLGESVRTTDTGRFIRDEWGTQGTMTKVYQCIRRNLHPLSVQRLLDHGPVLSGHTRAIAAKCFYSLLKLKQHQFISISKDPVTLEIIDITLGPRLQKA
ncbi:uncharacterized protein LOC123693653 [Colias croceus]|uniref:uncharacterized protein LOC123693653 n=1 Tax=Colias crocea TaxID=72248 RepID=UPI001E27D869|nr:uncharacterized protein LOC123693653 [Colias croceus]